MGKPMKYATIVARILLGLPFFIFGVNGFVQLIPMPPMPGAAGQLMGGLAASGYFFPLLAITETVAGAALLTGYFVPLALVVAAPLVLNILAIHLFLAPSGIPHAVVMLVLEVFLAWSYRSAFAPLLRARGDRAPIQGKIISSTAR
jgi:uncharacterized membrane protein YphA (DoxX/SURF4 family)